MTLWCRSHNSPKSSAALPPGWSMAQVMLSARESTSSMSLERSASSFSTLRELRISPEASSTHAQWNSFPASMPAQTWGWMFAVHHRHLLRPSLMSTLPPEDPADGSLCSESWASPSPISISGQGLLDRGRGAIPFKPSDGRAQRAILGPYGQASSRNCTRTTNTKIRSIP
jgi:hypothetical protein